MKNDGPVIHARFGSRSRSRAVYPGTSEQFGPFAHLAISNPSKALAILSLDFHIAFEK